MVATPEPAAAVPAPAHPLPRGVSLMHPAPPRLELGWAGLFYDVFGVKLAFWPLLPRDRARALLNEPTST